MADLHPAEHVLAVSDAARDFILNERNNEEQAAELALFLEINGVADGAFTYDMWFGARSDAAPNDHVEEHGDLVLVLAHSSVADLRGATLDLGEDGLFILNPNAPPAPAVPAHLDIPDSDLSSPIEQAVLYVLEHEVNPQIAMHGGRADLVAVHESVAYLRLSGGCQGCGLASVTLSQGISVALRESVPEIVDVVDVTEHELGENPYFEAAKK